MEVLFGHLPRVPEKYYGQLELGKAVYRPKFKEDTSRINSGFCIKLFVTLLRRRMLHYACQLTTDSLEPRSCSGGVSLSAVQHFTLSSRSTESKVVNIFGKINKVVQSNTTKEFRVLYYPINNNNLLVIQRTRHVSTLFGGHHQVLQGDKIIYCYNYLAKGPYLYCGIISELHV
jgi:hypothetical protein